MALQKPDYPDYGPSTFAKLQELVDTFYANDQELKDLIDAGGGGVDISRSAITLASGYSNNSAYTPATAVKIGDLVTLEMGIVNCPSSISGNAYFTMGTLPAGYRITDGKHRMGLGAIYAATKIVPVQFRINQDGTLNYLAGETVSSAGYLVIPAINFSI